MLVIVCPRGLLRTFERFALERYPREAYAVLLGDRTRAEIRVLDVWYPEDQRRYSTTQALHRDVWSSPWKARALEIAESHGLEIVGDIHSHPQRAPSAEEMIHDASPSEVDWSSARRARMPVVMGITRVAIAPRRRIVRTRLWLVTPHRVQWNFGSDP